MVQCDQILNKLSNNKARLSVLHESVFNATKEFLEKIMISPRLKCLPWSPGSAYNTLQRGKYKSDQVNHPSNTVALYLQLSWPWIKLSISSSLFTWTTSVIRPYQGLPNMNFQVKLKLYNCWFLSICKVEKPTFFSKISKTQFPSIIYHRINYQKFYCAYICICKRHS